MQNTHHAGKTMSPDHSAATTQARPCHPTTQARSCHPTRRSVNARWPTPHHNLHSLTAMQTSLSPYKTHILRGHTHFTTTPSITTRRPHMTKDATQQPAEANMSMSSKLNWERKKKVILADITSTWHERKKVYLKKKQKKTQLTQDVQLVTFYHFHMYNYLGLGESMRVS